MHYGCLRWDSPGRRHRTTIPVHITVICATKGLMDVSDMASGGDGESAHASHVHALDQPEHREVGHSAGPAIGDEREG